MKITSNYRHFCYVNFVQNTFHHNNFIHGVIRMGLLQAHPARMWTWYSYRVECYFGSNVRMNLHFLLVYFANRSEIRKKLAQFWAPLFSSHLIPLDQQGNMACTPPFSLAIRSTNAPRVVANTPANKKGAWITVIEQKEKKKIIWFISKPNTSTHTQELHTLRKLEIPPSFIIKHIKFQKVCIFGRFIQILCIPHFTWHVEWLADFHATII